MLVASGDMIPVKKAAANPWTKRKAVLSQNLLLSGSVDFSTNVNNTNVGDIAPISTNFNPNHWTVDDLDQKFGIQRGSGSVPDAATTPVVTSTAPSPTTTDPAAEKCPEPKLLNYPTEKNAPNNGGDANCDFDFGMTNVNDVDDINDVTRIGVASTTLCCNPSTDRNANNCSPTGSSPGGSASPISFHIPTEGCDCRSKTGTASSDEDLSFRRRGTGWGNRRAIIGLLGGGELTDGSMGWGPPPSANSAAGNTGWGAPPPPNQTVTAAWGNPVNASNQMLSADEAPSVSPSGKTSGSNPSSSPLGGNSQTPAATQPLLTNISWAAAASKCLPEVENPAPSRSTSSSSNGGSSCSLTSSSKPFEQLNSVREALFSPDGWGSENVKQDSAWNVDGMDNHMETISPWRNTSFPRNDGTELWKSTLSGQPPVEKPQPSSQWHIPQNPTDFKQWGEDEDISGRAAGASGSGSIGTPGSASGMGAVGARDNLWNSDSSSSNISGTWNPPGPRHHNGWDIQQAPAGRPVEWVDSPSQRRGGQIDDGTSIWGNKQPPNPSAPSGSSNWKDMPPNNMRQVLCAPPGPPGPGMPPANDSLPSSYRLWSADNPGTGDLVGWGDPLRSPGGGGARLRHPPNQLAQRGRPGWAEPPQDVGWAGKAMKPVGQKMISSKSIWNSQQYQVLMDMGCRKEDADYALRNSGGNLDDAIEMLKSNGCIRETGGMFDQSRRFPVMLGSSSVQNPNSSEGPLGYTMPPNALSQSLQKLPSGQPSAQQLPSGQPSAQHLRILLQQIHMAVQAGFLNPQILNQPLAPQTLISLSQLLQQIRTLQQLQQQHSIVLSQTSTGSNSALLDVSVNIANTKQNIQNLHSQISSQQAAYLKSQQMPAVPPQSAIGASFLEQGAPDIFGNYSSPPGGHVDFHLPTSKSRLALWKLPEEGLLTKTPGAASAEPGKSGNPSGLPFDVNPWTSSSGGTGWPETSKSSSSGLATIDSVSNSLDSFDIPEFEPGKPWMGPGIKNPEEDPNLTPGSMAPTPIDINQLSMASSKVNLQSLGLAGSTTDLKQNAFKSGYDPSNLSSMGQDLRGNSGPGHALPGLGGDGWNGSNAQNGDAMVNGGNGHCWIILKNLTQQVDAQALKTLCMQNGPLKEFQLWLNHNIALVLYGSGSEAHKAQKALHNCVLGNTTLHATLTSEGEATAFLSQLSSGSAGGRTVSSTPTCGNTLNSANLTSQASVWSAPGSDLLDTQQQTTPQLMQLLPVDLFVENPWIPPKRSNSSQTAII